MWKIQYAQPYVEVYKKKHGYNWRMANANLLECEANSSTLKFGKEYGGGPY